MNVDKIRLVGMFLDSSHCSSRHSVSWGDCFLGIAGAPHSEGGLSEGITGSSYRIAASSESLLLLVADTVSRTLVGSGTLPVGVLTSFMGAPLFLYLLVRGQTR